MNSIQLYYKNVNGCSDKENGGIVTRVIVLIHVPLYRVHQVLGVVLESCVGKERKGTRGISKMIVNETEIEKEIDVTIGKNLELSLVEDTEIHLFVL